VTGAGSARREGARRRSSWGRRVEARESRRCRGAAGNGGGGAATEKQSRGQRAEQGCQRKKKERRGFEGPLWNFQKSQGPFCKVKFPTNLRLKQKCDQNFVQLFKLYNFILEFNFKSSKGTALFKNFGLKSNFPKYLSLVR
jgi:hypothetical protein